MAIYWKTWAIAFMIAILLDLVWLGFIAKGFYLEQLSPIGRIVNGKFEVIMWAGAVVYILVGLAISSFVIPHSEGLVQTLIMGAVMGAILYGVYDFTNYATLKDYTLKLVFVDMAWGIFICGTCSLLTHWVSLKI